MVQLVTFKRGVVVTVFEAGLIADVWRAYLDDVDNMVTMPWMEGEEVEQEVSVCEEHVLGSARMRELHVQSV